MAEATIYAPATVPGRAAVAVLRLSGPEAAAACRALTGKDPPPPRRAALRRLFDPALGEPIDQALVVWFPGPHSATGEDLLEIQHHGGAAVQALLLEALARVPGCRPAGPGEFTRRAFLNGKLDLTAAEGLADLIDATTRAQARQALRQLDGALGRQCAAWRATLLDALARLEAEIDFAPEEGDVATDALAACRPALSAAADAIGRAAAEARRGQRLRQGVTIAITGPPNAGKSTLANLIARREVAIVTPYPGTTRDVLEVPLDLGGVPVTLLDTAGLRETSDPIEAEGVARARARSGAADAVVAVVDAGGDLEAAAAAFAGRADLLVANKVDLIGEPPRVGFPAPVHYVSCLTGAGLDALLAALAALAGSLALPQGDAAFTRERHRVGLRECEDALRRCLAAPPGTELALLAEDLRLALRALGRITGAVGVEEVLDRIFATFCIGK